MSIVLQVRREGGVVNNVLQYREAMKKKKKKAWRPNFKEIKEKRREEKRAKKEEVGEKEVGEKEVKEKEERRVTREMVTRAVNSSYIAQFGIRKVNHGINTRTDEMHKNAGKVASSNGTAWIRGTTIVGSKMMARDSLLLAPGIKPKVVAKKGAAREQVWRRLAGLEEGVEGAEGEEAEGDKEGVRRRRAKEDELVGFLPYFPVVKLSKFLDEKANR